MKNLIYVWALSALITIGLVAPSAVKPNQPASDISINDVMLAHNVPQGPDALSASINTALKLTSYDGSTGSQSPDFFARDVVVSINGNAFKRHKADPLGLRERFELYDGQAAYQAVFENGIKVEEVNQMGASQFDGLEFAINTFGLVPILNQISDVKAVYLGQTSAMEYRFQATTAVATYILYVDQENMIRKVVVGDKTIEYSDYRSVEGVWLPFIQRLSVGGQLRYELVFSDIDLSPEFPAGYFSHEAL